MITSKEEIITALNAFENHLYFYPTPLYRYITSLLDYEELGFSEICYHLNFYNTEEITFLLMRSITGSLTKLNLPNKDKILANKAGVNIYDLGNIAIEINQEYMYLYENTNLTINFTGRFVILRGGTQNITAESSFNNIKYLYINDIKNLPPYKFKTCVHLHLENISADLHILECMPNIKIITISNFTEKKMKSISINNFRLLPIRSIVFDESIFIHNDIYDVLKRSPHAVKDDQLEHLACLDHFQFHDGNYYLYDLWALVSTTLMKSARRI